MTNCPARRVVVLRALGLGDLLTAVPALRGIRRARPDDVITLLAPQPLAALLPAGLVDDVRHRSLAGGIEPDGQPPSDLAGAELAVNLHGRGPQSTQLLARLRPGRLVGFGLTSQWREDEHEVTRWVRLVTEAGLPADPAELDLPVPDLASPAPGAVVVHPGAAMPSRRWPAQRWGLVARQLRAAGHRVVVTGGPDERPLAEQVAQLAGLPDGDVLAGRTDVRQLAAVVGAARLVLAPDTGVAHLATALGTPSVVLFGPTPPSLWGPPDRAKHRVLWAGRVGDNAAAQPDPGLLAILPDDVVAAAAGLLGTG